MKVQSTLFAMTLAFGMISGACTPGSSTSGTGGNSASGGASGTGSGGNSGSSSGGSSGAGTGGSTGSGSGGAGGACPNVTACGGDVTGTWSVTSSCLRINGALNISKAGLDPMACTATIWGKLDVSGTWTANANTTYVDGTTTTGDVEIDLVPGCKRLSQADISCASMGAPMTGVGFSEATCTDAPGGGCHCTAKVDQMGSIGLPNADASKNGNWASSGNVLTIDGKDKHSYCVSGSTLTLTPTGWAADITGTITLESGGGSGSGGAAAGAARVAGTVAAGA